jgi:tetratricopeptide (TPR) repeat protein
MLAAACLFGLAACQTVSDNPITKLDNALRGPSLDEPAETGSVADPANPAKPGVTPDTPPLKPELLGTDPNDDLSIAKKYFRQGSYGLAERHFRKAVELHARDAEAWLGLAASYDRLRRFDLADRAYDQAVKIVGPIPEVMNNRGFSYMLRGDYRRARETLLAAQAKAPDNQYIANNLRLLDESARKAKAVH